MKWKHTVTVATLAASLLAAPVWAVPAKRITRSVTQSDGSVIQVTLVGDEFCHYYVTEDNLPVREGKDGFYYYIEGDSLTISTVEAHAVKARKRAERKYVKKNAEATRQHLQNYIKRVRENKASLRNTLSMPTVQEVGTLTTDEEETPEQPRKAAPRKAAVEGNRKALVILVNYKDLPMVHTQNEFYRMHNEEGYSDNGSVGSVREYFKDQSRGKFDVQFDVVGPYTLSQNWRYYGKNDSYGNDQNAGELIKEACQLANNDVNFADYDWDGDGEVESVYVYYAGYSEAEGASSLTVWPHAWTLTETLGSSIKLDGVKVDNYACSSELMGTAGNVMEGMGTFCHEFSHVLGLPDFYDTEYNGGYGMQSWDIMDQGSYNANGYIPPCYSALELWSMGWSIPTLLDSSTRVKNMASITDQGETFVLYNDAVANEFYLLENRQQKKWDKALAGHGLLISHVDYDETAWNENTINNVASHQRYSVIPADNSTSDFTVAGDVYPGSSGNTALTNLSKPAATLFNNNTDGTKYMNKPITNITENDGIISFDFMQDKELTAPQVLEPSQVQADGFVANWSAVDEASEYWVELCTSIPDTVSAFLVYEDFRNFPEGNKLIPTNVTASLDKYTMYSGWTGQNVFVLNGQTLLGTSSVSGWLQTPMLTTKTGLYYIVFKVKPYNTNGIEVKYTVDIYDKNNEKMTSGSFSATEEKITALTLNYGEPCSIRITPATRSYISVLEVLSTNDGSSTTEGGEVVGTYSTTDTHYTFTGLTESRYYYRVKALSSEGASPWSAFAEACLGLKGDANSNGSISVSDITTVVDYLKNGTEIQKDAADVNEDGTVNASDIEGIATKILNNE
jgi:M6 family metalloprotease-like protein